MQQDVGPLGQGERRRMHLAPPVRTRTEGDRPVIGDVGEGGGAVGDPEAQGATPLVGHVGRRDLEALDVERRRLQVVEAPVAPQPVGIDGEVGRRQPPSQELHPWPALLGRDPQIDPGVVAVDGRAERQPLSVVPMQVGEQDRAVERRAVEQLGERPYAGAGVEYQGGWTVVGGDGHRGGVAAVADECLAGRRGGAPYPEQVDPHNGAFVTCRGDRHDVTSAQVVVGHQVRRCALRGGAPGTVA